MAFQAIDGKPYLKAFQNILIEERVSPNDCFGLGEILIFGTFTQGSQSRDA
jgi:hypothetical protein